MPRLSLVLATAAAAVLLASCGTSTMPTAADMDRYYEKAEQMAEDQIALLDARRQRGEITQKEYEMKCAAIRGRITNQATELAWARHEIIEAQKRQLGIPTGDHPVRVQVPGAGGQGVGESFYRRAGSNDPAALNRNSPFGSAMGGLGRGVTPGTSGGSLGGFMQPY